jgi:hypothetical protein
MKRRLLLALPVLAVSGFAIAGCGTAAAAPRVLAPNPSASCGAAATAPCSSGQPAPIAEPGLSFSAGDWRHDPNYDRVTFTLTSRNTQPNTIYLSEVDYNEFDAAGNLWGSDAIGGNIGDGWPVSDYHVREVAVKPGGSYSVDITVPGEVASVQVTNATQSYNP